MGESSRLKAEADSWLAERFYRRNLDTTDSLRDHYHTDWFQMTPKVQDDGTFFEDILFNILENRRNVKEYVQSIFNTCILL